MIYLDCLIIIGNNFFSMGLKEGKREMGIVGFGQYLPGRCLGDIIGGWLL